jgi:hypothetical protein
MDMYIYVYIYIYIYIYIILECMLQGVRICFGILLTLPTDDRNIKEFERARIDKVIPRYTYDYYVT